MTFRVEHWGGYGTFVVSAAQHSKPARAPRGDFRRFLERILLESIPYIAEHATYICMLTGAHITLLKEIGDRAVEHTLGRHFAR